MVPPILGNPQTDLHKLSQALKSEMLAVNPKPGHSLAWDLGGHFVNPLFETFLEAQGPYALF